MGISFEEVMNKLPPERREWIEREAERLWEEYQALKESEADEPPARE